MAEFNPAKFVREVRQETAKVTWPTRRETMISTTMVLVLVGIASVFFLLVDALASGVIQWLLGIHV